ncbi:hypothetical protein ES695_20290 [Candidatus Atribacteria bacterium 1244-E10-H5-B2]|nr:MAG: hypothetical protein ES695_20290 [Candidatus Atribacteria bacterium 1244-E10-H5-B2]
MKPEILQKFSKEELIKIILRKDEDLKFYEITKKKFINQEKVGQISIEDKRYNIIFEREE